LLESFDRFNRELASAAGLRALLAHEKDLGLRILTSSGGIVQPRMVAAVQRMIEQEVQHGGFQPAASPDVLAYAIVRLAEAFLYNDAAVGVQGDTHKLHEIESALLGLGPAAADI
jgi:hypothetical protein